MPKPSPKNVAARYLQAALPGEATSASRLEFAFRSEIAGARDLRVALLDLAAAVAEGNPETTRVLATRAPRMSSARVKSEWQRIAGLLRPELVERIGLVVFGTEGVAVCPAGLDVQDKLATLAQELPPVATAGDERPAAFGWTPKTFAVWRTLLDAWLNAQGALPVDALQRRSGCSYPTARAVIDHLAAKREVTISKDRSVAFARMPQRSLEEVLIGSDRLRGTSRFVDATGSSPNPERLLRRVLARHPSGVRIGGVAAARHYVPDFNLNGLPRLDLVVNRPARAVMTELDPGLEASVAPGVPALVVVHEQHGADDAIGSYASVADTFLDLMALHLTEQATEFASNYRQAQEAQRG